MRSSSGNSWKIRSTVQDASDGYKVRSAVRAAGEEAADSGGLLLVRHVCHGTFCSVLWLTIPVVLHKTILPNAAIHCLDYLRQEYRQYRWKKKRMDAQLELVVLLPPVFPAQSAQDGGLAAGPQLHPVLFPARNALCRHVRQLRLQLLEFRQTVSRAHRQRRDNQHAVLHAVHQRAHAWPWWVFSKS